MAKPIITKYNPIPLLQANSVYAPLNGFFIDRLANFEVTKSYCQRYANADIINMQFQSEAAATFEVKLVSDTNTYNLTTSEIVPPISYAGTNKFYKSTLTLTSVVEGVYYLRVKITTDKIYYFISEPIFVAASHENTILIKYSHELNQFSTLFNNSLSREYFYLRVEGGVKESDIKPESDNTIFIDQNHNSIQLDGEVYNIYTHTFGDCEGIPEYIATKLNQLLILNEIFIDNVRYKKNEGAKFEKIEIDSENYPLANYKVDLLQVQSYIEGVIDDVVIEDNIQFEFDSTDNLNLKIQMVHPLSIDISVDWGDGTIENYTGSNILLEHDYLTAENFDGIITCSNWAAIYDIDFGDIDGIIDIGMKQFILNDKMTEIYGIQASNTQLVNFQLFRQNVDLHLIFIDGNALSEVSVNNLLIEMDAKINSYFALKIINISGGTSAAPTGLGITAKNSLIAKGWNVATN